MNLENDGGSIRVNRSIFVDSFKGIQAALLPFPNILERGKSVEFSAEVCIMIIELIGDKLKFVELLLTTSYNSVDFYFLLFGLLNRTKHIITCRNCYIK